MLIFLVGFMGTGKTEVGKSLAKKLKLKFLDIDKEIEKNTGETISNIFKNKGEKKFREYENKTLKEVLSKDNVVVATGGGIVVSDKNRKLLKKKGLVVGLFASIYEILKRIKNERHRPLLEGYNKKQRIAELLKKRVVYYKEVSDCIINTDGCSVKDIVSEILLQI